MSEHAAVARVLRRAVSGLSCCYGGGNPAYDAAAFTPERPLQNEGGNEARREPFAGGEDVGSNP